MRFATRMTVKGQALADFIVESTHVEAEASRSTIELPPLGKVEVSPF